MKDKVDHVVDIWVQVRQDARLDLARSQIEQVCGGLDDDDPLREKLQAAVVTLTCVMTSIAERADKAMRKAVRESGKGSRK